MSQQCKHYHYFAWSWLYTLCIVLYFGWSEDLYWPVNTCLTFDNILTFCALIYFLPHHSTCASNAREGWSMWNSEFWCVRFWGAMAILFRFPVLHWLKTFERYPLTFSQAKNNATEAKNTLGHNIISYFVSPLNWHDGGQATSDVITA